MESNIVSGSETRSLISSTSNSRSFVRRLACNGGRLLSGSRYCKWLLSKPVLVVVLINFVVGASYAAMMIAAEETIRYSSNATVTIVAVGLLVALVNAIFSPLSGFLADVHFGRYRMLSVSIYLIFGASLIVSFIAIVVLLVTVGVWSEKFFVHRVQPVLFVFAGIVIMLFMSGIASYQANFIPFGLDQLLEAPSTSLALFIHWSMWAHNLGTFIVQIVDAVYDCSEVYIVPFCFLLSLPVLFVVIILCLRTFQFSVESRRHNPYKVIYKVLVYVRKHRYPLQRSAFTYCGDEIPSRLDYAKEKYGGPFTTELVENVKTFFKIFTLLLSLGPVFVLEAPVTFFCHNAVCSSRGRRVSYFCWSSMFS